MIISHKYKFIFVKTIKTAGTSIEIALSEFCGPDDIITPLNYTDEKIRKELGYLGAQNYNIPFYRYGLLNALRLIKRNDRKSFYNNAYALYLKKYQGEDKWDQYTRKRRLKRYYNHMGASLIKQFIGEKIWNNYYKFCFERNPYDKAISYYFWHTRNQSNREELSDLLIRKKKQISNWGLYTINNKIAVDFVGRYENLEEDLETIRRRIGLSSEILLPEAKVGVRKNKEHYSLVLSEEDRRLVEERCSREISEFGYVYEDKIN